MKNSIKKIVLPVFLSLVLLTGCGKAGTEGGQNIQSGEADRTGAGEGARFHVEKYVSVQWDEQGGNGSDQTASGAPISVYSAARGDTLYALVCKGAVGADNLLYTYSLDTEKTDKTPFSVTLPEREKPLFADALAVAGEGEFALRLSEISEEDGIVNYFCRTDLTGKPLDEEALLQESGELPPASGRYWTDPEGSVLLTSDGEEGTEILRYDLSEQKSSKFCEAEGFLSGLCIDGQGRLCCLSDNSLWRLDPETETLEQLMDLAEAGIELTSDNHLLAGREGRLAICCVSSEGAEIWILTDGEKNSGTEGEGASADPAQNLGETGNSGDPEGSQQSAAAGQSEDSEGQEVLKQQEPAEKETLHITCLYEYDPEIIMEAKYWAARSVKYQIHAEARHKDEEELEALRTRTLADVAAGQGPELLIVTRDDLQMLVEKEALMDLSELVPEDIQEQILPGVRELGTVDGVWAGFGWSPSIEVSFTSDRIWSGDKWTISDILELAEDREDLEGIFGWRDLTLDDTNSYHETGSNLLYNLVMVNLGDSPFLNLENGTSSFDGEEFIRVLEFCKRYGTAYQSDDGDEMDTLLKEGKLLVVSSPFLSGYCSYASLRARLADCHPVGWPAEKGSGNSIRSDYYLAVNKNTADLEAVKDCISYLYSYDCQMRKSTVRRDVADDQIVYDGDQMVMLIQGSKMVPDKSPDGNSYKEEYLKLLEELEPEPYCPQEIKDIVTEVSDAFFAGDRSAKEAAELIQRRVQLYFNEQG